MKNSFRNLSIVAVLAGSASLHSAAYGQVVSQTTTTSNGTVSEFSPDSIVVHSETAAEPIHYTYSKETTVVDEAGNPVDVSIVKTGIPVQVYYEGTGEHMIARKIVVHRAHATTTTTGEVPVVQEHKATSTTTTTETH